MIFFKICFSSNFLDNRMTDIHLYISINRVEYDEKSLRTFND